MPGKSSFLCSAIGVAAEAPLLLQVENKGPHLAGSYLGDIGGETISQQEIVETTNAASDYGRSLLALTFASNAEPVTMN